METLSFCLNASAVALMGTAIGLERQWQAQHTTGMRTNALVAFGANLFVSIPQLIGNSPGPAHLAGQVATGVGFLGGGVILREGLNVRGMNTAATIWCSSAVGALAGAGRLLEAFCATIGILALHLSLRPFSDWLDRRHLMAFNVETNYRLRIICQAGLEALVRGVLVSFFQAHSTMMVQGLTTQESSERGRACVVADIVSQRREDQVIEDLMATIHAEPSVFAVSWEKKLPAQ